MQDAAIATVLRKYDTSDLIIMLALRQLRRAQAKRVSGKLYNPPGNDQPESSRDGNGAQKLTEPAAAAVPPVLTTLSPSSKDWPFTPILGAIGYFRDREDQPVIGFLGDNANGETDPQRH